MGLSSQHGRVLRGQVRHVKVWQCVFTVELAKPFSSVPADLLDELRDREKRRGPPRRKVWQIAPLHRGSSCSATGGSLDMIGST